MPINALFITPRYWIKKLYWYCLSLDQWSADSKKAAVLSTRLRLSSPSTDSAGAVEPFGRFAPENLARVTRARRRFE